MATESKFHAVVGRAIADPDFRARLTNESRTTRAGALEEVTGEPPSDDVLDRLDEAVKSLDALAEAFEPIKVAS
jgi:hypothetical protein